MKNDKKPKPKEDLIFDQFYDTKSVESATGYTGLTPTPPISEADAESYSEIHGMPIPNDMPEAHKKKKQ